MNELFEAMELAIWELVTEKYPEAPEQVQQILHDKILKEEMQLMGEYLNGRN